MKRLSPRELRRLSKRLGLNFEEVSGVKEVRIVLENGKCILFDFPKVLKLKLTGMGDVYQIMGESRIIEVETKPEEIEISEEDVQLVAEQAGVSLEEARRALIETKGDLAQAILMLTAEKSS